MELPNTGSIDMKHLTAIASLGFCIGLLMPSLPLFAASSDAGLSAQAKSEASAEDEATTEDGLECEEDFATGSHLRKNRVCTTAKQRAEQEARLDEGLNQMRSMSAGPKLGGR